MTVDEMISKINNVCTERKAKAESDKNKLQKSIYNKLNTILQYRDDLIIAKTVVESLIDNKISSNSAFHFSSGYKTNELRKFGYFLSDGWFHNPGFAGFNHNLWGRYGGGAFGRSIYLNLDDNMFCTYSESKFISSLNVDLMSIFASETSNSDILYGIDCMYNDVDNFIKDVETFVNNLK